MSITLGSNISGVYVGGSKIGSAYLGSSLIFNSNPTPAVLGANTLRYRFDDASYNPTNTSGWTGTWTRVSGSQNNDWDWYNSATDWSNGVGTNLKPNMPSHSIVDAGDVSSVTKWDNCFHTQIKLNSVCELNFKSSASTYGIFINTFNLNNLQSVYENMVACGIKYNSSPGSVDKMPFTCSGINIASCRTYKSSVDRYYWGMASEERCPSTAISAIGGHSMATTYGYYARKLYFPHALDKTGNTHNVIPTTDGINSSTATYIYMRELTGVKSGNFDSTNIRNASSTGTNAYGRFVLAQFDSSYAITSSSLFSHVTWYLMTDTTRPGAVYRGTAGNSFQPYQKYAIKFSLRSGTLDESKPVYLLFIAYIDGTAVTSSKNWFLWHRTSTGSSFGNSWGTPSSSLFGNIHLELSGASFNS